MLRCVSPHVAPADLLRGTAVGPPDDEPAASARLGAWYNVNGMAWQLRPNGELIITQCRGQVQVARVSVSAERIVLRLDMSASASCCGWTRMRSRSC